MLEGSGKSYIQVNTAQVNQPTTENAIFLSILLLFDTSPRIERKYTAVQGDSPTPLASYVML